MTNITTTIAPDIAFNNAILCGALSADKNEVNYAGNYMYMHTLTSKMCDIVNTDLFKHVDTREYIKSGRL
jgi:hypothetical protein